jgi:hypothetical protein
MYAIWRSSLGHQSRRFNAPVWQPVLPYQVTKRPSYGACYTTWSLDAGFKMDLVSSADHESSSVDTLYYPDEMNSVSLRRASETQKNASSPF